MPPLRAFSKKIIGTADLSHNIGLLPTSSNDITKHVDEILQIERGIFKNMITDDSITLVFKPENLEGDTDIYDRLYCPKNFSEKSINNKEKAILDKARKNGLMIIQL